MWVFFTANAYLNLYYLDNCNDLARAAVLFFAVSDQVECLVGMAALASEAFGREYLLMSLSVSFQSCF